MYSYKKGFSLIWYDRAVFFYFEAHTGHFYYYAKVHLYVFIRLNSI